MVVLRQPAQPYLKNLNGLLIRRPSGSSETTPGDVELNWITSTSNATKTAFQQQDLRLRKNNVSLNEVPLFQLLFGWNFHLSPQIQSSHDFELKKTTATHAFLDEVGPSFWFMYRINPPIVSSLSKLSHIRLFHLLSERRHRLMCLTIFLQR